MLVERVLVGEVVLGERGQYLVTQLEGQLHLANELVLVGELRGLQVLAEVVHLGIDDSRTLLDELEHQFVPRQMLEHLLFDDEAGLLAKQRGHLVQLVECLGERLLGLLIVVILFDDLQPTLTVRQQTLEFVHQGRQFGVGGTARFGIHETDFLDVAQ